MTPEPVRISVPRNCPAMSEAVPPIPQVALAQIGAWPGARGASARKNAVAARTESSGAWASAQLEM